VKDTGTFTYFRDVNLPTYDDTMDAQVYVDRALEAKKQQEEEEEAMMNASAEGEDA
jgi:hypothetical protein